MVAGSNFSCFEIAGETFSVDSSITSYHVENGRRYHAYREGSYWCPNDEKQNENLNISHYKFLLLLAGKLTLVPIEKDFERVLDIGTGTGIWAVEFADEYPNITVLGTDLSPIQPSLVPPNCIFEIDDAQDRWTYPVNYFDLIHVRGLFGSINDWSQLYKRAYTHLKPGGYIEQLEVSIELRSDNGALKPGGIADIWAELFTEAGNKTGQSFRTFEIMRKGIVDAGFVNVKEIVYKLPLGGWPADPKLREIGDWALLAFDIGLEGFALATLSRVMGWNTVEIQVLLAQMRALIRDETVHLYHEIKIVYAQKPPSPSS